MHNKIKTILILAIAFVIALPLVSCGGGSGANKGETLITNFETDGQIDNIGVFTNSGVKIARNTDKKYVSEGSASMYLEFEGEDSVPAPGFYRWNWVWFYVFSDDLITHGTDFSDAECLLIDIYNDSDRAVGVTLKAYADGGELHLGRQPAAAGRMNTLKFDISYPRALYMGVQNIDLITLELDKVYADQTPVKLYLDNFRTRNLSKKQTYDFNTVPKLAKDEFAFFENDYLFNTLRVTDNPDLPVYTRSEISKNTDLKFVSEGAASLKVTRHPALNHTSYWRRHEFIVFPTEYLKILDFSGYDINQYQISVDVYNDYDYDIDFVIRLYSLTGRVDMVYYMPPNQWSTYKLPLNALTVSGGLNMDWANISRIEIMLHEFYGPYNAVMYIDNMKIEKAGL